MAKVDYEQPPVDRSKRVKPPTHDDGFHYVITERPGPNDEGSSPEDLIDNMNYEFVGEMSRRKNLWRIPKEDRAKIETEYQERSRRMAKTVAPVTGTGGENLDGVVRNFVEDEEPVDINKLLGG